MSMKKSLLLAVLVGLLGSLILTGRELEAKDREQIHIAKEVLRFHIRANSDSESDQADKLYVKEKVLEELRPILDQVKTREESKLVIEAHIPQIEAAAEKALEERGQEMEVQAYLTKERFPVKTYGEFVFPAGEYEALRIDIGEAKGHNWWCVMYPSLCFVDESHGIVPPSSEKKLRKALTPEEFDRLKPKVKWKLWEIIKEW